MAFIHQHFGPEWHLEVVDTAKSLSLPPFSIYYMIHAEQFLYSYLLTQHQDSPSGLAIVGNSFEHYVSQNKLHGTNEESSRLFSSCGLEELLLPELEMCYAAFNDSVLLSRK